MHDAKTSVGYARVSTDDQTAENQILKLRGNGVSVIFCDNAISGKTDARSRTDFRAMMKYIGEHKEIKHIVVYELSRFGRNMQDSINLFLDLEKSGYRIYSLTESWTHTDDPAMRSLMLSIVSWMNEQELVRLTSRIKAGIDRAKTQGTKSGKPIGRPSKEIDPEVIDALRTKGMSWNKISVTLDCDPATIYRARRQWKAKELGRLG